MYKLFGVYFKLSDLPMQSFDGDVQISRIDDSILVNLVDENGNCIERLWYSVEGNELIEL